MNSPKRLKSWLLNLGGVAVVLVVVFLFSQLLSDRPTATGPGTKINETQLMAFAKYLTDKGVTMYGAYWCSHCQNQKKLFGTAFQYINYVECTKDPEKCTAAGVLGYPTWTFSNPDGAVVNKLEGEVTLEKLAQTVGYQFPKNENETTN